MKNEEVRRMVRRLSDGKVLPVVDEQGNEICVEERFDFWSSNGRQLQRPLWLWHRKSDYEFVNGKKADDVLCRLRHHDKFPAILREMRGDVDGIMQVMAEAADEISRLREEIVRLRIRKSKNGHTNGTGKMLRRKRLGCFGNSRHC